MKTIDVPEAASSFITPSSSSVSCGVSTAVGSSRMSRSTLRESALRISTRCWVPTGRSSTSASGSTGSPCLADSVRTISRALAMSSTWPALVGSWPSIMFSATVITGTSWKCWCTMPMPRRMASRGSLIGVGVARARSPCPSSGVMRPKIWLTRVDLPAPFSPSRATISPRRTCMLMSRLARTLPKLFDSPAMSSSTSPTLPSPKPDFSGGSSSTASVVAIASRCSGAVSAATGVGSYSGSSVITRLP